MSNSCEDQAKSTGVSKMAKISGSAKNYEHPEDKAERLCRGGFADGGAIPMPKPDPRGYYPPQTYSDGKPVYSDAKAIKRDGN